MSALSPVRAVILALLAGSLLACGEDRPDPTGSTATTPAALRASAVAGQYVVDFVSTTASGADMNDVGDVVGTSYNDPGCGPFCLGTQETVVWRGGVRMILPAVPGLSGIYPSHLNNQGVIAGLAGIPGTNTHAVVWSPRQGLYIAQDIGALPGMSSSDARGIDDQGRVVGWSSTGGAIPTAAAPYMWSATGGMVNLASLGYPNDFPMALSPGGTVATSAGWYRLGNPASFTANPAPPQGFFGVTSYPVAINDAGDQARFLPTTSGQTLVYYFRLPAGGTWQMLSSIPTGNLSSHGVGSINAALDVTGTVGSTGIIAAGPSGLGQSIASLISPAYGVRAVGGGGPMNAAGQILTSVYFGTSPRLVKLTPAVACGASCLVASTALNAVFVQDPSFPGSCFQGGRMYNQSTATVTVTDEGGAPLANVLVNGRFMDDYWTSNAVSGTTNAAGVVSWSQKGLCGVGSIEFLVEKATLAGRTFDKTRGTLARSVIPTIGPVNQPPVARFTSSCNATTRACSFNGSTSSDDAGIVSYAWTFGDGTTGTGATTSHTYAAAGTYSVRLTVTDGGGLTNAITKAVTVGGTTNKPPVAAWSISCQPAPAHSCTVDGAASTDPDGTVVGYKWTNVAGTVLSTQASFTRTFARTTTVTWTLTVTDNGGKTGKLTKTFTAP